MIQAKEEFTIEVSFPADEAGLVDQLKFDQDGNTELTMESSEQNANAMSIGRYFMSIDNQKATDLKNKFDRIERQGIPKGDIAPPGSEMVTVRLSQGSKKVIRTIDPSASSQTMCAVSDELKDIANQAAMKGPVHVVTMEADIQEDKVAVGGSLTIQITLRSTGTKDAVFVNPLSPVKEKSKSGRFTLWAVRSDLPPEDLWPHHSFHNELSATLLDNIQIPPQENDGVIKLKPSETAEFIFHQKIDCEPGGYAVKIIFETLNDEAELLNGKIISQAIAVTVTK